VGPIPYMSPEGLGLQSTHSHIPAVCAPVPCKICTQFSQLPTDFLMV